MSEAPIRLAVSQLVVEYPGRRRSGPVSVINDVSFSLREGETVALVGESGSGKTTIGKAVLGLVPVTAGTIEINGEDTTHYSRRRRRPLAAQLQAIFQNPYGSLNPSLTIGQILSEPLRVSGMSRAQAAGRVQQILTQVQLPPDSAARFPSNFSGGQRQRIAIARAVAVSPGVIVCDEPTSALDVSTQAAVLELLVELQSRLQVSYLFITHDLALVRRFADRTLVLEGGRIVEHGTSEMICDSPQHPYTRRLVASAPVPDPRLQRQRREANRTSAGLSPGEGSEPAAGVVPARVQSV